MNAELKGKIDNANVEALRRALSTVLSLHITPVFGAAKLVEHEIAALNAMQVIGFVDSKPDDFNLMERLGITKSKARSLLLQQALRNQPSSLERKHLLCNLISQLKFHDQKNEYFMIEVADPYMIEVLKKEIRNAGQISIATLSPSIISISRQTIPVLFDYLLDDSTKQQVIKRYNTEHLSEGLKDFKEIISALFGTLTGTVGGKPAELVAEKITGKTLIWLFDRLRSK